MLKVKKLTEVIDPFGSKWAVVGENSGAVVRTFDRKEDAREFCEFVNRNEFTK